MEYAREVNVRTESQCERDGKDGILVKASRAVSAGAILISLALLPVLPAPAASEGKEDVVLGMSTALTGPAADLGKNMKQGVLAGLDRANRGGGLNGKKLRLLALDDGYEPTRTAPNMRRLIQDEHVLAVIGNVGTPTAIAATA